MRGLLRLLLGILAALTLAGPARADDNRPLSVAIEQEGDDIFRITWKIPPNVESRHIPAVSANACKPAGRSRNWADPLGTWREESWTCPVGLAGRPVTIDYPLANPGLTSIVRYRLAGQTEPQTLLLQPQDSRFSLAAPGEARGSFLEFLVLGVEHIWVGLDHLLFVAGLIFIAGTPRRVLMTITGFTIAHSITLALSALDVVRLPTSAIEGAIALSIVFLAVEIVKGPRDTLTWRRPIAVAASFGLLHGFGFAAVLREIGLPQDGLAAALLAFNLGIEIGQALFAALLLALLSLVRRLGRDREGATAARLSGYAVGTLASYWMFDRLLQA